jgi:hypothetical protein
MSDLKELHARGVRLDALMLTEHRHDAALAAPRPATADDWRQLAKALCDAQAKIAQLERNAEQKRSAALRDEIHGADDHGDASDDERSARLAMHASYRRVQRGKDES